MRAYAQLRAVVATAFATALAAALAIVAGPAAAQQKIILKYAHVGAEGETQTQYAAELAKLVGEKTQGRIEIRVFPGSQLGNLSEMIDGIRIGAIQMGHHDFSSLDRIDPDVAVFNAPFLFSSPEQAMRATNEATSPVLQEINKKLVAKGGVRIVGNFYRGARQLSARYPVHSPKDMEGKKFRSVPVPLWNSMIKGMGAIPTPVEISEIMPALMTGLVDGQENPLNNIIARKMWEANKYVMMTSHMESVLAVFVNEKAWEGIPDADRKIMQDCFAEMAQRSLKWAKDAESEEIATLKKNGVTIIDEKSGLDLKAFRESVGKQILKDYPNWAPYIARLKETQG